MGDPPMTRSASNPPSVSPNATSAAVQGRTQLPLPGDPNTLYLVDLSGYVFRAYHAIPALSNTKGEPTHAVYGTTAMLHKLIDARKPAMLAVAMDSKTDTFRKKEFEGYKANRPPPPPDLSQQMTRVQQVVQAYEIPVFQQDGVEADDLIATVVRAADARNVQVVIVSADKDLLALVGPRVWMYDTMNEKVYGEPETVAKLGVPPAQVPDVLALVGDASDNVPGVPSVGPKTAASLIQQYGSIDGVYEHLHEIKRPALRQALQSHRESVARSRRLVTLHDHVDIEVPWDNLVYTGGDNATLEALFDELEFHRFAQQIRARRASGATAGATTGTMMGTTASNNAVAENTSSAKPALETDVCEAVELQNVDELDAWLTRGLSRSGKVRALLIATHTLQGGADLQWLGLGFERALDSGLDLGVTNAEGELDAVVVTPDVATASQRLREVLADASIPKWSQSLKRDDSALASVGLGLAGDGFDCLLASYVLEPERRSHQLLDVLRHELGPGHALVGTLERGDAIAVRQQPGVYLGAVLTSVRWLRDQWWPRLERDGLVRLLQDIEMPLTHVLASMERVGIALDVALLHALSSEVSQRLQELQTRCHTLGGGVFNLNSPKQLEVVLFDHLQLPVIKKTKTGRSTDQSVLEELSLSHPLPETILEYRKLSKLQSTYLDVLPRQVNPRTGRVHTQFNQAVAATGRLSSSDPNLQNIPIRDELGRRIREAFVPEPGWWILSADYSQIELRLLAHLSHDPQLVEAFQGAEDVHVRTARALFGVEAHEVTRAMRGQAKTVNFAVIYGQTDFALSRSLKIPRAEAARYIQAFFERYAGVKAYLDRVVHHARRDGYVQTLFGRRRTLADLRSSNRTLRMQAERMAFNTPIQGTAADILKLAMIRVQRSLTESRRKSRMLLTVHDELVLEVPSDEKQAVEQLVRGSMQDAVVLDVPLVVEVGWGRNWGAAH
jgi:DNA polymerase-1